MDVPVQLEGGRQMLLWQLQQRDVFGRRGRIHLGMSGGRKTERVAWLMCVPNVYEERPSQYYLRAKLSRVADGYAVKSGAYLRPHF